MLDREIAERAAEKLRCDVPAVLAVAEVEASGEMFWTLNSVQLPPLRLESHWFGKQTGYRFNNTHPHISTRAWDISLAAKTRAGAYAQFTEAFALDPVAAIEACSWGAFQIMGFHWRALGYASAHDFRHAMETAAGQVDAFVRFVIANNLDDELRKHDWHGFTRGYNGSGQVDSYSARIAAAYERHRYAVPSRPAPVPVMDNTVLRKGSKGARVLVLQKALSDSGYPPGTIDGIYGQETEAAVRMFQRDMKIMVDGIAGPVTRRYLGMED